MKQKTVVVSFKGQRLCPQSIKTCSEIPSKYLITDAQIAEFTELYLELAREADNDYRRFLVNLRNELPYHFNQAVRDFMARCLDTRADADVLVRSPTLARDISKDIWITVRRTC